MKQDSFPITRRELIKNGVASLAIGALAIESIVSSSDRAENWIEKLPWRSGSMFIDETTDAPQLRMLYSLFFLEYFSRFLINSDHLFNRWWIEKNQEISFLPENERVKERINLFSSFCTSVHLGLQRFTDETGPIRLASILYEKYGDNSEQVFYLTQLFSMIEGVRQPISFIELRLEEISTEMSFTEFSSSKVFATTSLKMLPHHCSPAFDEKSSTYFIPEFEKYLDWMYHENTNVPFRERELDFRTYADFAIGGAVGCAFMHGALIPLDVVKTRLQTDPLKNKDFGNTLQNIIKEEGVSMLLQGAGPTLVGYFFYGFIVYPGYEFFKRYLLYLAGPSGSFLYRTPLILLSGALATFFACFAVCPAEAVRIRLVANPNFASSGFSAVSKIVNEEGFLRLYDGFQPTVLRQIMFGMMKFLVFESCSDLMYGYFPDFKDSMSTSLFVSLCSGLVAGVASCVVSQPADTILSEMNKTKGITIQHAITKIWDNFGPAGFFLGVWSRAVWSGIIISGQFFLYDFARMLLHVSTSDLYLHLDALWILKT